MSSLVAKPTSLLYFTKGTPAYMVGTRWAAALAKNTAILIRPGVATATYATLVRREALRARCHVRFIGDLDPEDLAIFLSLAYGDYRLRPRARSAVPIIHAGINDAWLDAAEAAMSSRHRPLGSFPECIAIDMNEAEQHFLRILENVGPPLEKWVGPRCARLLRGGLKIELEGVLNPELYRDSYVHALGHLLMDRRRSRGTGKHASKRAARAR
jgi:hypothetical protein